MTKPLTEMGVRNAEDAVALPRERRYPLDLGSRRPELYEQYHESNASMWDVEEDVRWQALSSADGAPEARRAAGLVWSWQAWVAFGDVTASEAALVRSCLELDVAADLKFCIATRATERAAAADAASELAAGLDGYVSSPPTEALAALFETGMVRRVLHRDVDFDALVLGHFALVPTVDRAVAEARLAVARNEAVRDVLGHVVTDLRRQEEWAWSDVAARLPGRTGADRQAIAENLAEVLDGDLLLGARWTALLDGGLDGADEVASAEVMAAAEGLGGLEPERQIEAVVGALELCLERAAGVGLSDGPVRSVLAARHWWR